MQIWTVANQKGGVGKTTTSVTLGGLLAQRGEKTLLIDLDPHGSLSSYFGYNPDTIEESVYSLFHREVAHSHMPLASMLRRTSMPKMDLLPASTALVALDRQIGAQEGMGLVLHDALNEYKSHYQAVIIDCPPTLGVLMVNALAACNQLIIPVQTEFLALHGLERMLKTLEMIMLSNKHALNYTIVPTMFDKRTRASKDCLEQLRKTYTEHLWNECIPVDTQFREASRAGQPLCTLNALARGNQAYSRLLSRLQLVDETDMDMMRAAG
jgi:chromosome partitioning protein